MPKFIMMMGLPGSGKTVKAAQIAMKYPDARIFSSDEYRNALCIEGHSKKENAMVFDLMHSDIRAAVKDGVTIIYDATNLSGKRRAAVLEMIGSGYHKTCVCMLETFEECVKRDQKRECPVGKDVIWKFYRSFCPPHRSEGWDKIVFEVSEEETKGRLLNRAKAVSRMCDRYDQHNHWHENSLKEHMNLTFKKAHDLNGNTATCYAALLHDMGKPIVKIVGEDGEWHYPNHANVGAYEVLCSIYPTWLLSERMDYIVVQNILIDIPTLIYYHTAPMFWKDNPKLKEKIRKKLGHDLFNSLVLLNMCDRWAHKRHPEEGIKEEVVVADNV